MNFSFINKIIFLDSNIEIFMLFYIEIKKKIIVKLFYFILRLYLKNRTKMLLLFRYLLFF
jgi:hypothetical protein